MQITMIVKDNTTYFKGVTKDLKSPRRGNLTYTPGTTVTADSLDLDPNQSCSHGIHFNRTLAEALRWCRHGKVVSIRPHGIIIDCGDKMRAESVEVVNVYDLYGANLSGADLCRANLSGADEDDLRRRGAILDG